MRARCHPPDPPEAIPSLSRRGWRGRVRRAGQRLWPDALSRDRERSDDVDPGQPSEPVYDYHGRDDRFCGAIDLMCCDLDFWRAVPCLGEAGSIAVHHVRTVHVSATNFPGSERRLLLFRYRAADAWPALSFAGGVEKFDDLLLGGSPTLIRRLSPVPVRLPLPPAEYQGSICENQQFTCRRFFETAAEPEHLTAAE